MKAAVGPRRAVLRRLLVVGALVAAGSLVACGTPIPRSGPPPPPQRRPDAPVRMLFVGGSVTFGLFASAGTATYPSLVADGLRQSGVRTTMTTVATSGATARTALHWDLEAASDVVIVQLGANDWSDDISLSEFAGNYRVVLSRVRSASPHALLLCLGLWQSRGQPNGIGITGARYNDVLQGECLQAGGRYVDLAPIYADPANHGPIGRKTFMGVGDWYHPNDRGHTTLAQAVLGLVVPEVVKTGAHVNRFIPAGPLNPSGRHAQSTGPALIP